MTASPFVWESPNPIWDAYVSERGICHNCWCRQTGCGCCVGCGDIDADLFGAHGYVCVIGVSY